MTCVQKSPPHKGPLLFQGPEVVTTDRFALELVVLETRTPMGASCTHPRGAKRSTQVHRARRGTEMASSYWRVTETFSGS